MPVIFVKETLVIVTPFVLRRVKEIQNARRETGPREGRDLRITSWTAIKVILLYVNAVISDA